MPAIGATNTLNTRRLVVVILAAFFSAAGILFLIALCFIAYDTARIEEAKEEASTKSSTCIPSSFDNADYPVHEPDSTTDPDPRRRGTIRQPRCPSHRTAPRRLLGAPTTLPEEPRSPPPSLPHSSPSYTHENSEPSSPDSAFYHPSQDSKDMSEPNPDQDWATQALQNQNRPPTPPETHVGPTTGHNPFRRSTRGTYGLRTSPTLGGGSERYSPNYYNSRTPPSFGISTPCSNYQTPPWSSTLLPPTRSGIRVSFPGRVQDQGNAIASPSPRRPDRAMVPSYFPSAPGRRRIPTPTPTPLSPEPLSDDDEFRTPHPSLIHSPTHIPTEQTTIPSTHGDPTTSGPSSRRSTETSSAPTEVQHGRSDGETSSGGSSGPTLRIPESAWTSTSPPRVATQSWESRRIPDWQPGSTPIATNNSTRRMPGRGFSEHDQGLPTNRQSSKPTSAPWHTSMRTGPEDGDFRMDEETFGEALRDAAWDWTVGPMPDSPPQRNRRRQDQYHGKGRSVLLAGAGEDDERMGEGSGQPPPPPPGPQNPEELVQHYAAALLQIAQLRDSENNLREQLTDAQNVNRGRPPGRQLDPD
ncbi:hypothetical protein ARMGADRAFT_1090343 [Armillaria gallica]|uniref:Transmembrane protein n=1 Tax=Armillaria gallica TaxID=47427 RepID=A0A2H3CKQ2_ARMGA|nr:hypothetical protein ARMGADRAFT_1090343 [Armillaria gallica]